MYVYCFPLSLSVCPCVCDYTGGCPARAGGWSERGPGVQWDSQGPAPGPAGGVSQTEGERGPQYHRRQRQPALQGLNLSVSTAFILCAHIKSDLVFLLCKMYTRLHRVFLIN